MKGYHSVPVLHQTMQMSCWYTAYQMVVAYYRRIGRGGRLVDPYENPETYERCRQNQGGYVGTELDRVARMLGFHTLYLCFSETGMANILTNGPAIYTGVWMNQNASHAVVLIGMYDNWIYVNDPWFGQQRVDYNWFISNVLNESAYFPLIVAPQAGMLSTW